MLAIRKYVHKRKSYRAISFIFVVALMYLFVANALIPLIRFMFMSNKPSSDLGAKLDELIPKDLSIDDIVTDQVLMTSWDMNHRSPRFFTKWSYNNLHTKEQESRLTFNEMVHASANSNIYFYPFEVPDRHNQNNGDPYIYISGENVAQSPAMYGIMHAVDRLGINQDDIHVMSIGTANAEPDKLSEQTSLLEWAIRLVTLTGPVKKHTMDYMSTYFLKQGSHRFSKYEL